jgi:phospholipid/cholesterol/gamma-HCH transport system substrate-binding protein
MKLSTSARVGLLTLIGVIALAAMVTWKSNFLLLREGRDIVGSFSNIEGLTVGSEVRYRGFSVGKVMRIDPGPRDIKVFMTVKSDVKVPSDSKLRVAFDGIVGLKYLEVRPGTSETEATENQVLYGTSTAGIVDFIDLGAQNLDETKAILETFRKMVQNQGFQDSLVGTVGGMEKLADNLNQLTDELRTTNRGIMEITNDPDFQQNVKGTIQQTNNTLTSANEFFDSFGNLNMRTSGDISYGSLANQVRGNLDILQSDKDFVRLGIGEGPTRDLSLQDIIVSRKATNAVGMKLGMINSRLGGGLDLYVSSSWMVSGDLYDINNTKPNVPKFRITSFNAITNYMDTLLQADDMFNPERNYSFGIRIKGGGGGEEKK